MEASLQDFPPHILYKILTRGSLSALDLVHVEATCYAFRASPGFLPFRFKSIVEIAVVDLCNAHPVFSVLPELQRMQLLHQCGNNWKMLLKYLQPFDQANGMALTPKEKEAQRNIRTIKSNVPIANVVPASSKVTQAYCGRLAEKVFFRDTGRSRSCFFPMEAKRASLQDLPPHLLYKILTQESLSALDLAHVEATCYAFRAPLGLLPMRLKSIVEIAVLDLCETHPVFSVLPELHRMQLLQRCGKNWKMLLKYLQSFDQANGMALTPKGKVQVATGKYYSLVLARDKGVFACGSGLPFGSSRGFVSFESSGLFLPVSLPQNVIFTQVSSSYQHVAFITSNGELYTYGDNKAGCCGFRENNETIYRPRLVATFKETHCKQVAAGLNFTMVLTVEGHVYTCGKNEDGQLGHGDTKKRNIFTKVDMLDGFVVQVSAGAVHALAVTRNGFAFSWGYGGNWCLGHTNLANQPLPRLIEKLKDENLFVTGVSAGFEHSVALDSSGQVHTWGRGDCGALGHGYEFDTVYPRRVAALNKVRAVQVCSKKNRTFVLSDDGRLYGFGRMGFGCLNFSGPTVLDYLKDHPICQVSAGLYHTLVVTCEGNVLGFGDGGKGQLGKQHLRNCPEPIEVVDLDLLAPAPFE